MKKPDQMAAPARISPQRRIRTRPQDKRDAAFGQIVHQCRILDGPGVTADPLGPQPAQRVTDGPGSRCPPASQARQSPASRAQSTAQQKSPMAQMVSSPVRPKPRTKSPAVSAAMIALCRARSGPWWRIAVAMAAFQVEVQFDPRSRRKTHRKLRPGPCAGTPRWAATAAPTSTYPTCPMARGPSPQPTTGTRSRV